MLSAAAAALRSLCLPMRCSFTLHRSTNRVTAVTGGENSEDATLSIGLGKWGRATPGQLLQSLWDWLLSSPQNGLQGRLKTCDTADCKSALRPPPRRIKRSGRCGRGASSRGLSRQNVGARAPVRALTWRGESPRQAEVSPACDRRLLRRGDTGWRAAGGELPVRNIDWVYTRKP